MPVGAQLIILAPNPQHWRNIEKLCLGIYEPQIVTSTVPTKSSYNIQYISQRIQKLGGRISKGLQLGFQKPPADEFVEATIAISGIKNLNPGDIIKMLNAEQFLLEVQKDRYE